ncbi:hypothetical protein EHQ46_15210 [Leptospira yanagawae]|uniref:Uncharacterized protein n=1 Tax=Leptospira yanagawae TaxID=293069 RepID=A0ABY2LZG5_9LEPT|nr:hypothetical protein [Leptospira yanagawae]TGL19142.1 hypothetical protein EHQ46_15210 [Leptospira yanagawae]
MGRRDNLKILTTAILVVLLLSSFIFAFIYRNEIYQKLQTIGKNKEVEMVDREIAKSPDTIPPPKESFSEKENRDSNEDRTSLPELPSLDDMEPDLGRPRSVSVSGAKAKDTKESGARLKEKLDRVENEITPKQKDNAESKTSSKDLDTKQSLSEKSEVSKQVEESFSEQKKTLSKSKKGKSEKETSHSATTKSKSKKSSLSSKRKTQSPEVRVSRVTKKTNSSSTAQGSSLEVRMREVEQKLNSQSEKNEKRFLEIERRIDSLEKALAK